MTRIILMLLLLAGCAKPAVEPPMKATGTMLALESNPIYWAKKAYANSESTKREMRQFIATWQGNKPNKVSAANKERARAMAKEEKP